MFTGKAGPYLVLCLAFFDASISAMPPFTTSTLLGEPKLQLFYPNSVLHSLEHGKSTQPGGQGVSMQAAEICVMPNAPRQPSAGYHSEAAELKSDYSPSYLGEVGAVRSGRVVVQCYSMNINIKPHET